MIFNIKLNKNIFYFLFLNAIIFYQRIISPIIPARCRYYPTCSNYGKQALKWHGVRSGSWLLLKRISRCHPLGGHGIDFVPVPLASYRYNYVSSADSSRINAQGLGVYRDNKDYVSRLNRLMALE